MEHPIDPPQPDTLRGRQLAAVLVVGKLIELDLPEVCNWDINRDGIWVQLAGDNDPVGALTKWAEFLCVTPHADGTPYEAPGGRFLNVRVVATYRHVFVRAFTGIPVDEVPAEWLAEREAS